MRSSRNAERPTPEVEIRYSGEIFEGVYPIVGIALGLVDAIPT
jgi:hypothetical protein